MERCFQITDSDIPAASASLDSTLIENGKLAIFYFQNFEKESAGDRDVMVVCPMGNEKIGRADLLIGNANVVMNIVGNHSEEDEKTKGLLYQDFVLADCNIVILHGRVISVFDIVNKQVEPQHLTLNGDFSDPYNFSCEPKAIWMMDKDTPDTTYRWKVIILFRNGEVKELKSIGTTFLLYQYLQDINRQPVKLSSKIVKILRNKNSTNQPVYFIVERESDSKRVLGTIEFTSQTYREFDIPGTNATTTYVVLDNKDPKMFWQDIACFSTTREGETYSQKMVHARVRIGCKILSKNYLSF